MTKIFTKILGVIALTGWMGAANAALIFDFSWDTDEGIVIGAIYGLTDNEENMSATGFVLSSIDGQPVNIDLVNDHGWFHHANTFNVSDGDIVEINFFAFNIFSSQSLDVGLHFSFYKHGDDVLDVDFMADTYGSFVSRLTAPTSPLISVTVPEPSSVILMLLGLVGLSFARYRKQY
jgi:hypothetical protein